MYHKRSCRFARAALTDTYSAVCERREAAADVDAWLTECSHALDKDDSARERSVDSRDELAYVPRM